MTQRFDYLSPGWVVTAPTEGGCYLAGFVFETEEEGRRTMRALADLYNSASKLAALAEQATPGKEG